MATRKHRPEPLAPIALEIDEEDLNAEIMRQDMQAATGRAIDSMLERSLGVDLAASSDTTAWLTANALVAPTVRSGNSHYGADYVCEQHGREADGETSSISIEFLGRRRVYCILCVEALLVRLGLKEMGQYPFGTISRPSRKTKKKKQATTPQMGKRIIRMRKAKT